jgi:tetratricopeptide (TPR) repeat protein
MLMLRGEYEGATVLLEEALARAREARDQNATAWALFLVARVVWLDRHDSTRATALYRESLALSQAIRDKCNRTFVLLGLGEVAEAQQNLGEARAYYEEAVALHRERGADWVADPRSTDWIDLGLVLFRLAQIAQAQGDYELARGRYAELIYLVRLKRSDDHVAWLAGHALGGLGALAGALGDARQAASLLGCADAAFGRVRDGAGQSHFFTPAIFDCDLADAQAQLGEAVFAVAFAEGRAMPLERALADALADRH